MKISTMQLKQIILEEYMKEEGISLSEDKAQELLDFIRGTGPKPDWYDREGDPPPPPGVPSTAAAETMPIPRDDAPESEYQGFQKDSGPGVEDQLTALIQGMDPESVAELFQAVFEKIPGVELARPGDEDYPEEVPGTEYIPGAMGRPPISLGPLREAVFEKIVEMGGTMYRGMGAAYKRDEDEEVDEGEYRDLEDEGEVYDLLDPHGFGDMSDAGIVNQAWKDGIEEMIILDGEGDLANREEVIAALKDV